MAEAIDHDGAMSWLAAAGYTVLFRENGWVECLVLRAEERWLGRGADQRSALADVVWQMLPSHASRVLAALEGVVVEAPDGGEAAAPPAAGAGPEPDADREPEIEPEPEPDAGGESPAATTAPLAPTEVSEPTPAVATPPREQPSSEAIAAVVAEVALLEDRLEAAREAVGLMTPALQRAHILAWACRARALQEAMPDVHEVHAAVTRVIRALGLLCKLWWPGSVRALQLDTRPIQVLRDAGADGAPTWARAAEVVELDLDDFLAGEDAAGAPHGWRDGARLAPAPREPAALLRDAVQSIERLAGPVGEPPHSILPDAIRELPADDIDTLTTCARRLRWLRGDPPDAVRWGLALGRLRWAATIIRPRADELADALDPELVPEAPWAAFARASTPQSGPLRDREALRLGAPQPGAAEPAVLRWIADAIDALRSEDIVAALRPVREVVIGIDEGRLPHSDRRLRRRLRDIKHQLQQPEQPEQLDAAAGAREDRPPAPAALPGPTTAEVEIAALRDRVRAWTAGKRALFVSNREDPQLRARLEDLLGLDLAWAEATPRRIDAQCRAVASGTYDFVLSATGFTDHSADAAMSRAAHAGGARYVRVDRGRPVACLRALARDVAGGD